MFIPGPDVATQRPVEPRARLMSTALTTLTYLSGLTGFVVLLGGFVLATRFAHAGLPVSATLSLIPPQQYVATALTEVVSKAVVNILIPLAVFGTFRVLQLRDAVRKREPLKPVVFEDPEPEPEPEPEPSAAAAATPEELEAALAAAEAQLAAAKRGVHGIEAQLRHMERAMARNQRNIAAVDELLRRRAHADRISYTKAGSVAIFVYAALLFLVMPLDPGGIPFWASNLGFAAVAYGSARYLDRALGPVAFSIALIMVTTLSTSIGRQLADPLNMEIVRVVRPGKPALVGDLVTIRDASVVVGRCGVLRVVPTPQGARFSPKPRAYTQARSVLQRLGVNLALGRDGPSARYACPGNQRPKERGVENDAPPRVRGRSWGAGSPALSPARSGPPAVKTRWTP